MLLAQLFGAPSSTTLSFAEMSTFKDVSDILRGDEIARKWVLLEAQIAVACAQIAESVGGCATSGRM